MSLDAGIADRQHIHFRHPSFRAQERSRNRLESAWQQAKNTILHAVGRAIVDLGGNGEQMARPRRRYWP
jgi:hypothetical protein